MIDHKEQRYEIAQEVAMHLKDYYDAARREKKSDFNDGYLFGIETSYMCFRNRLMTYDDMDDNKLLKLGVAYDIRDVDVKEF